MFISVFREADLDDDQGLVSTPLGGLQCHIVCNYARCFAATRAARTNGPQEDSGGHAAAHQSSVQREGDTQGIAEL